VWEIATRRFFSISSKSLSTLARRSRAEYVVWFINIYHAAAFLAYEETLMHVKVGRTFNVHVGRKRQRKKERRRIWENRLQCNGCARFGGCDTNFRVRAMNLRRSDDDDYLFAGTPNADDSFVKACGITTQRTSTLPCDKKEVSALARGNGGSRREEGKKRKEWKL